MSKEALLFFYDKTVSLLRWNSFVDVWAVCHYFRFYWAKKPTLERQWQPARSKSVTWGVSTDYSLRDWAPPLALPDLGGHVQTLKFPTKLTRENSGAVIVQLRWQWLVHLFFWSSCSWFQTFLRHYLLLCVCLYQPKFRSNPTFRYGQGNKTLHYMHNHYELACLYRNVLLKMSSLLSHKVIRSQKDDL